MNGSFSPVQVSGQQVQEGLCDVRRLQAAGQPRPGPERPNQPLAGPCRGDGGISHAAAHEVVPAVHDMLHQGWHGRRHPDRALMSPLAVDRQQLAAPQGQVPHQLHPRGTAASSGVGRILSWPLRMRCSRRRTVRRMCTTHSCRSNPQPFRALRKTGASSVTRVCTTRASSSRQ